eukprot:4826230-Amphidinium_carterae.2
MNREWASTEREFLGILLGVMCEFLQMASNTTDHTICLGELLLCQRSFCWGRGWSMHVDSLYEPGLKADLGMIVGFDAEVFALVVLISNRTSAELVCEPEST